MLNLELVQIIIQGGAVGLLLAFGYFGYKLANRIIGAGLTIITNHLSHLNETMLKVEKTLTRLDEGIDRLVRKK
jgi:hypothetical protein